MIEFNSVFVDTCVFIYYLEHHPDYYEVVMDFFAACYQQRKIFTTSVITVEEYSIVPYRQSDYATLDTFHRFVTDTDIRVIEINRRIADHAARIRASYPAFKAMDALQLATAVEQNCDLFLTNDKQLRQFRDIRCVTADELSGIIGQ